MILEFCKYIYGWIAGRWRVPKKVDSWCRSKLSEALVKTDKDLVDGDNSYNTSQIVALD